MDVNSRLTLADLVSAWLDKLAEEADKMLAVARRMKRLEQCDYTVRQCDYAKHLVASIKWVRSRIPRNWHSGMTADMVPTAAIVAAASPKARPRQGDVPSGAELAGQISEADEPTNWLAYWQRQGVYDRRDDDDQRDIGGEG